MTAPALESGQIDLKPEYLGSGLGFYDKTKPTGDPETNATELQAILDTKGGGITVLGYTPGEEIAIALDCAASVDRFADSIRRPW